MTKTSVPVLVVSALAAVLLPAAPAAASDHLQQINEVLLSNGGTANAQFVELHDHGEPFPAPPYHVVSYDQNGGLGTPTLLTGSGLALNDWTVVTATAAGQGLTGNQTDPLGMDPVNGQECFERNGSRIYCVNWGSINTVRTGSSGTVSVPTPGDGQSVSLCSGSYVLTTPTPKAPNNCPPTGGGGSPGGGSGPDNKTPPTASVAPKATLGGAASQKLAAIIKVKVTCSEACLASAAGTISVPGASKNYKIKSDPFQIAKGGSVTLRLRVKKGVRNKASKAIRKGKKVRAKLTITAKNTAGTDTAKRTIKLKK